MSIIVTNVNEIPLFGGSANFENNIAKYEFSVEEEIDSVIKPGSWVERGGYKDTSDTALRYGPHQHGYTAATCQTHAGIGMVKVQILRFPMEVS